MYLFYIFLCILIFFFSAKMSLRLYLERSQSHTFDALTVKNLKWTVDGQKSLSLFDCRIKSILKCLLTVINGNIHLWLNVEGILTNFW